MTSIKKYDVIVIGGGQSALACGYFLRRTPLSYVLLDNQTVLGGSWTHMWKSLTLFSPAGYSSLPGKLMPDAKDKYPTRQHTVDYLNEYETRYEIPVERPVNVISVRKNSDGFLLETSNGEYIAKVVISATGTWSAPFIPAVDGIDHYKGKQLHSSEYFSPESFIGQKTLIIGGGNTGAQLLAELSLVTKTIWSTLTPPSFLPDEVDGRVLFDIATAKYNAEKAGKSFDPNQYSLGNIVMVPPLLDARKRGVLVSKGNIQSLTSYGVVWDSGEQEAFDVVLWCTGFRYATRHLSGLVSIEEDGKIKTSGTRAIEQPGLWLIGYGNWTGFASATLIGVGRSARSTVHEIQQYLITILS